MATKKRVAVVGAGTIGGQALWRLAARGADVTGFDRFAPGHDRGAGAGESRVFRTVHIDDDRYVPLVRHADTLWQQLQRETGRELRRLTGKLYMGPADGRELHAALEMAAEYGLDHEVLDAEALAKRHPQFAVETDDIGLLDRHAGWIRPELTIHTAVRRAEELGARVHRRTEVREIAPAGSGVDVRTDAGTEHFDAAVVTVGPWVGDLLPDLPWSVDIRRAVNAWFLIDEQHSDGAEWTPFSRTAPTSFYGVPSPDGISVKLGVSSAHHRQVDDPNRLDRTVDVEELDLFADLVRRHLPGLHPEPVRSAASMEGYTASTRPLVGPLPGCDAIVLLAGFSGQGFKVSPAMGDIAADLALDGTTAQPIEFLSTIGRTTA